MLVESKLIIWHSEDSCKFDFFDKDSVRLYAKDLVRRGVVICPICGGFFTVHRVYSRGIKNTDSSKEHGWVAQLRCKPCNRYPSLIPDFIMPYKHYKAEVIEAVIIEYENGNNAEYLTGYTADISTMRRWVRQFKERAHKAVECLQAVLLTRHSHKICIDKLKNMTLRKQLLHLLYEFKFPKIHTIIGSANIILTTQNCGFL